MTPPLPHPPTTPLHAKLLIGISSILLTHSCYSAHEHTATAPTTTTTTTTTLPLDIILETLLSVSLLCVGIVLAGWELKPIAWRIWAGQQERETGQGPYAFLESRLGFVDIRAKRGEFGNWVKEREASHS
ncbi:membrane magnesium transporter-domain-containing protein [Peziza echinospora]|nr:membrane magnesium transporter-domain-containing protein [Peziza echinospora]